MGSLVAVLAVVLAALGAVVVRIRCVDAASEAARLAARGDEAGARAVATRLLPDGTDLTIETVEEEVRVRVRAPPLGSALPGLRVGADAVAVREPPSVGPDPGAEAPDGAAPPAPAPDDQAPAGTAPGGPDPVPAPGGPG